MAKVIPDSIIHKNLDKSGIRDFISDSIVNIQSFNPSDVPELIVTELDDSLDKSIKKTEHKIEVMKRELENQKKLRAILSIMKTLGWEEFDVSDMTLISPNNRLYRSFIGTQEEYEIFEKNIKLL